MTCEKCGHVLQLGDWAWCPHGRATFAVIPDDVPGGFLAENGFDKPTRFDSRSAHAKALAAKGLEVRAKWAGENDKHLTRWDTVDLDAARTLLERGPQAIRARQSKYDNPWPRATEPITITEGRTIRRKDLT